MEIETLSFEEAYAQLEAAAVAVQLHSQKRALLTDFCIEWHTERLVR